MTIREQEEPIAGPRKEALNATEQARRTVIGRAVLASRAEGPRIVGDSQAGYRKHRPFRS